MKVLGIHFLKSSKFNHINFTFNILYINTKLDYIRSPLKNKFELFPKITRFCEPQIS